MGRGGRSVLCVLGALLIGTGACSSGSSQGHDAHVRVVSQNLLHGIACPADTDGCRLPDRVALFVCQLEQHGCPDVVGVQEANEKLVADA